MRIDPGKLFPNGMVAPKGREYVSQLLMSRDDVPSVLEALEDLGVTWSTGIKPTEFDPSTECPSSTYFCLEFYKRGDGSSLAFCYDDYGSYRAADHDADRFWIEEVLEDEIIAPTPLNLAFLLDTEAFK